MTIFFLVDFKQIKKVLEIYLAPGLADDRVSNASRGSVGLVQYEQRYFFTKSFYFFSSDSSINLLYFFNNHSISPLPR